MRSPQEYYSDLRPWSLADTTAEAASVKEFEPQQLAACELLAS